MNPVIRGNRKIKEAGKFAGFDRAEHKRKSRLHDLQQHRPQTDALHKKTSISNSARIIF